MSEAQKVHQKEIEDRLDKIAFHFNERDLATTSLQQYSGEDYYLAGENSKQVKRIVDLIHRAEDSALSDVHLMDNVQKYFRSGNLKQKQLIVLKEFVPYKVAAAYVNTMKHGTAGGGQVSAKADYWCFLFSRQSEKPQPSDPIVGDQAFINFDGRLFAADNIMEALIRIWEMFLRFHTTIDTQPFQNRIGEVLKRRPAIYSFNIPEGVSKLAKKESDHRKSI